MSTKVRLFGGIDRGAVPRCFARIPVPLAVLSPLCSPLRWIAPLRRASPTPQRLGHSRRCGLGMLPRGYVLD